MNRPSACARLVRLVLFGGLAVTELASCQSARGTSRTTVADSCVAVSEFQLRGIFLSSDTTGALATLGKPLRVSTDSGVDDGGVFERQTFFYRDFEVVVVRGEIDKLATRSRDVATPMGLKPGLSVEEVRRLLLRKGVTFPPSADTVDIANCDQPGGGSWIRLILDHRRLVRAVEIFAARP